jgi:hypothetical protein
MLDKYNYIESVEEIVGWGGNSSELPAPSAFDIKMTDNRRLFLSYVESNKKMKSRTYPTYIEMIGDFVIYGRIPVELIAEKTGLKLTTV